MSETTLEYDGDELSIDEWGIELGSFRVTQNNRHASTLSLLIPNEGRNDTPTFAFEGKVIVRFERTFTNGAWTDGYIEIIAWRTERKTSEAAGQKGATYTFEDLWYWLGATLFQQPTKYYDTVLANLAVQYTPDVLLFTKISEGNAVDPDEDPLQQPGFLIPCSNGKQIKIILNFLLDTMAALSLDPPFQVGTIEPNLECNSYPIRNILCDAALEKCLEREPNCTSVIDYSTTPPTLKFLRRASLTPVTLALANGQDHQSITLANAERNKLRAVMLLYRFTNSVNGANYFTYGKDKYGANGQNNPADPEKGPRVHTEVIDLAGASINTVRTSVTSRAIYDASYTQAQRRAWWALHKADLADAAKFSSLDISEVTAFEEENPALGVNLNLYPYQITEGAIQSWMQVGGNPVRYKRVTLRATYNYTTPKELNATRTLTHNCVITNAATGNYETATDVTTPEEIPTAIAQHLYDAFNEPRWEGEDVRVSVPMTNAVRIGNKVNLSNGLAEHATMGALIRSISKTAGSAEVVVSFGPPKIIAAADLIKLSNFSRFRRVFEPGSVRASGQPAGISTLEV